MQLATTTQPGTDSPPAPGGTDICETLETYVWIEEHDWLYGLLQSGLNAAPKFRVPDLISACVSQLLARDDASDRLFAYLGAELIMRAPGTPRRKESMWRAQYQQLQILQRSPANRYPNPRFQLDQLTTGCVALACREDRSGAITLRHARINIVRRSAAGKVLLST